jgi:uncharacterized protein YndB with AHSA1/START domain
VITIAMSTRVGAERKRVWSALTDPSERLRWDGPLEAPIDVAADHPRPGDHARWRYRLHGMPVVLHERTLEVVEGKRVRSAMSLGPFRFDLAYTLEPEDDGARTRLSAALAASNVVPVVGGALDRFAVRRLASEIVAQILEDVRAHCAPRRRRRRKARAGERVNGARGSRTNGSRRPGTTGGRGIQANGRGETGASEATGKRRGRRSATDDPSSPAPRA